MTAATAAAVALPPTPAQVGFLLDLVRERDLPTLAGCTPEQAIAKTRAYIEAPGRDRKEISRMIDVAKSAPYRAAASASASASVASWVIPESVPNSKFALQTEHLTKVPPAWQRQELLFLEVKHLRGKRHHVPPPGSTRSVLQGSCAARGPAGDLRCAVQGRRGLAGDHAVLRRVLCLRTLRRGTHRPGLQGSQAGSLVLEAASGMVRPSLLRISPLKGADSNVDFLRRRNLLFLSRKP